MTAIEVEGVRKPRPRKGSGAHLADRAAVLRVAAQLFDRHGYVETTMDDIAKRLRISKPTLYRHAKSKSDILQLIINDWIDQSDHGLEEAMKLVDPSARIPFIVRDWTDRGVANSAHLKVFLSDEQDMPPRAVRRYREWSKKAYSMVREMVIEGQAAGHYRPDADPTVTTFSILGFILLLPRWLRATGRMKPRAVADEFLKTLTAGLAAAPPGEDDHG